MNSRPRLPFGMLTPRNVPPVPGVYAVHRLSQPVYVGEGKSLAVRWKNHRGRGVSMTSSALRRNVAEHLGIAFPADIKARRYVPTLADAENVTTWLASCEVAWIECLTHEEAKRLEADMKLEWLPPLTKR